MKVDYFLNVIVTSDHLVAFPNSTDYVILPTLACLSTVTMHINHTRPVRFQELQGGAILTVCTNAKDRTMHHSKYWSAIGLQQMTDCHLLHCNVSIHARTEIACTANIARDFVQY